MFWNEIKIYINFKNLGTKKFWQFKEKKQENLAWLSKMGNKNKNITASHSKPKAY